MITETLPTILHGGSVQKDGTFMETTRTRLDKTIELYNNKLAKPILFNIGGCTRGTTKESGLEEISELDYKSDFAKPYAEYLIKHGVNATDIIASSNALDTVGEVFFLSKIIKDKQFKKIRIVTSDFHMNRCLEIYRFILGDGIEIIPERAYSQTDTDARLRRLVDEKEIKSLDTFRSQFEGIKSGDIKLIEERFYSKHILYKHLPEDKRTKVYD